MKKPLAKLRARSLEQAALAKASGGRGTYHGYTECMNCGYISAETWTICPVCKHPYVWDPKGLMDP